MRRKVYGAIILFLFLFLGAQVYAQMNQCLFIPDYRFTYPGTMSGWGAGWGGYSSYGQSLYYGSTIAPSHMHCIPSYNGMSGLSDPFGNGYYSQMLSSMSQQQAAAGTSPMNTLAQAALMSAANGFQNWSTEPITKDKYYSRPQWEEDDDQKSKKKKSKKDNKEDDVDRDAPSQLEIIEQTTGLDYDGGVPRDNEQDARPDLEQSGSTVSTHNDGTSAQTPSSNVTPELERENQEQSHHCIVALDPGHGPGELGAQGLVKTIDGKEYSFNEYQYNDEFADLIDRLVENDPQYQDKIQIKRTRESNQDIQCDCGQSNPLPPKVQGQMSEVIRLLDKNKSQSQVASANLYKRVLETQTWNPPPSMLISIHHDSTEKDNIEYFKDGKVKGTKAEFDRQHVDGGQIGTNIFVKRSNQVSAEQYEASKNLGIALQQSIKQTKRRLRPPLSPDRPQIGSYTGLQESGLAVVRNFPGPAALIEVGTIVNKEDEAYVTQEQNREKLARAIIEGAIKYCEKYPSKKI